MSALQSKYTAEGKQYRRVRHQLIFVTEYIRKQIDNLELDSSQANLRYKSLPPIGETETYFWSLTETPRDTYLKQTIQTLDQTQDSQESQYLQSWKNWLESWFRSAE